MTVEPEDDPVEPVLVEARWPILCAVVAAMVLTLVRPSEVRVLPSWVLPVVEIALLVAVVVNDPLRVDRRAVVYRRVAIGVVTLLVLDSLMSTALLIDVLVHGGALTNSAQALLTAGAGVWFGNVIAFALLYWLLDGGGAAARARRPLRRPVDLAFPQHLDPELAPAGWRPRFGDYLYLGLTASAAFSPTDVMPLSQRAKLAMGAQSIISLAVLGLVIARAVNVFS